MVVDRVVVLDEEHVGMGGLFMMMLTCMDSESCLENGGLIRLK